MNARKRGKREGNRREKLQNGAPVSHKREKVPKTKKAFTKARKGHAANTMLTEGQGEGEREGIERRAAADSIQGGRVRRRAHKGQGRARGCERRARGKREERAAREGRAWGVDYLVGVGASRSVSGPFARA